MLVSVIIPCYNAAPFLKETVDSVLGQSLSDYEVILIDDGSTDETRRIIESYGDRVRAEFGPNRGASVARNRGTALARGEFIQYLDADDLLAPDALAQRVEALRRCGADVAYSDWQRLVQQKDGQYKPGRITAKNFDERRTDMDVAIFSDQFWSPPAGLLYRRSIVERIGKWNESLPVIQDARFLLDAALQGGRFVHVPGVGAYYRQHKGQESLSSRSRASFVGDCFENAIQMRDWWQRHGGITPGRKEALIGVLFNCVRVSFDVDRALFRRAWTTVRELDPDFHPLTPRSLRFFSRLIGYPAAEAIESIVRKIKKRVASFLSHGTSP